MKIIQFSRYREFTVNERSCFYDRLTKKYGTIVNGELYVFDTEGQLKTNLKKMCG